METADADYQIKLAEAKAKRIARLWSAFNAAYSEHQRCVSWHNESAAASFATAMIILDACIGAESGDDYERVSFDRQVMDRLRDIARDRDVLRRLGLVEAAPAPAPDTNEAPE